MRPAAKEVFALPCQLPPRQKLRLRAFAQAGPGGAIAQERRSRLARAGIRVVQRAFQDTVSEDERFFSYRRACLRGERAYGRGLSAIALVN